MEAIGAQTAWIYAVVNFQHIWQNIQPFVRIVLRLFGVYCYTISSKEALTVLFANTRDALCLGYDEDLRPVGLAVDRRARYVVYRMYHNDRVTELYCTPAQYKRIMREKHQIQKSNLLVKPELEPEKPEMGADAAKKSDRVIKLYCRKGDHGYAGYKAREVQMPPYTFSAKQAAMFGRVMRHYNEHNRAVAFISGPIGAGKTCFAYMLARELRTGLCASFSPIEPSDTLDNLYMSVEHTAATPLVVVLDEVDVLLARITEGVPSHKNFRIGVQSKVHWNDMLDRVQLGCYPNLILLLISNKSREQLGALDPSYLRDGRVDHAFEM